MEVAGRARKTSSSKKISFLATQKDKDYSVFFAEIIYL